MREKKEMIHARKFMHVKNYDSRNKDVIQKKSYMMRFKKECVPKRT